MVSFETYNFPVQFVDFYCWEKRSHFNCLKIRISLLVIHFAPTPSSRVLWLSWWRHQMETFSALLALCVGNSPVTGDFPSQRPVTRCFDVFFQLRLNKRLSKQSWGWLWRHCNVCNNHTTRRLRRNQGLPQIMVMPFYQYMIPVIKIRRSHDRLIFTMEILTPEKKDSVILSSASLSCSYQDSHSSTKWQPWCFIMNDEIVVSIDISHVA